MKVGDIAFYISNGQVHAGTVLFQKDNIITIREKKKVKRKRVSQVAGEVSDEFKRIYGFGLAIFGKGSKQSDC